MSERWPAKIEFDERDAILHDGKGRAGVIACDSALAADGLGAEIARRWNAYDELVVTLYLIERALGLRARRKQ